MSIDPKEIYGLCMNCGVIMPMSAWTYWQQADDEAPEWNGEQWRPSQDGETDPMMLCPYCGWEHRDTDDGSGVFEGSILDVTRYRDEIRADYAEGWRFVRARL